MFVYVILDPENENDATFATIEEVQLWADDKPIEQQTADISDTAERLSLTDILGLARHALTSKAAAEKLDRLLATVGF